MNRGGRRMTDSSRRERSHHNPEVSRGSGVADSGGASGSAHRRASSGERRTGGVAPPSNTPCILGRRAPGSVFRGGFMRSMPATTRLFFGVVFISAVGWASQAYAQLGVGTWLRTDEHGKGITMTVESPFDGTDVPALVGGKPSGETM